MVAKIKLAAALETIISKLRSLHVRISTNAAHETIVDSQKRLAECIKPETEHETNISTRSTYIAVSIKRGNLAAHVETNS